MAAIDHGADAVYIGPPSFGARAAAGNSVEDIARLCSYAHQYDARVYVTVNTIIFDDELPALRQLLRQLAEAGADAVLFQDMAVPLIVKEEHLPLQLHASTQTDNRTAEKVEWLSSLGASRVVLARELSVEEIADIHHRVPDTELEVFVHGALCVSYSGLCYASQHCFHRSANRGECAQLCRMKYDLVDADGRTLQHDRYLLSLKDLNQSQHLEELIEAGATSFKIEGRLKDIAYVKNTTAAYSQLLDRFISRHPGKYERASLGRCRYTFTPDLRKTFNRGYTTYFLHGRQPDIYSPDTPKAIGEFVGTVKDLQFAGRESRLSNSAGGEFFTLHSSLFTSELRVSGTASFANGDGLCFIDDDHQLQGFRVNRAEGNRLIVSGRLPSSLRRGMSLYRNNDQQMERLLSAKSSERKIPVTMTLEVTPDGYRLIVDDGRHQMSGSIVCEHQQAQKPQHDNIVRELSKLGNTPYECTEVRLPEGFDGFIPASRLSKLRRNSLASPIPPTTPTTPVSPTTPISPITPIPTPVDTLHLNVANHLARQFYASLGINTLPAFELQEPQGCRDSRSSNSETVLMRCRHCLRFALGHCVKHGGTPPTWHEPLFLTLANGRRFRLHFDCKNCVMEVLSV